MFVGLDGAGADRLHRLPDRPAANAPRTASSTRWSTYVGVNHDSTLAKVFINPYAAVPSMHCAFALMIGGSRGRGLPPLVGESVLGLLADS